MHSQDDASSDELGADTPRTAFRQPLGQPPRLTVRGTLGDRDEELSSLDRDSTPRRELVVPTLMTRMR